MLTWLGRLHSDPITSLALSLSTSHLLIGTNVGQIHLHALPSLQHLRTLSPSQHKSCPITHLSTLLRPADLHGTVQLGAAVGSGAEDKLPIRSVGVLERMRVGRRERDRHEVTVLVNEVEDVSVRTTRRPGQQLTASCRSSRCCPSRPPSPWPLPPLPQRHPSTLR